MQTLEGTTVVISNQDALVSALRKTFPKVNVLQVKLGESYVADKQSYVINKNQATDFIQLIEDLNQRQLLPKYIIYENDLTHADFSDVSLKEQIENTYYLLIYLTQALLQQKPTKEITLLYLNYLVDPRESPFSTALAALSKTVRLEHAKLNYRIVNLPESAKENINVVLQELKQRAVETRYDEESKRWTKDYQEIALTESKSLPFKRGGVYVITGGMGGLGLIFARYLAKHYQAKLILMGRSELKAQQQKALEELKSLGAEVVYVRADVSKAESLPSIKAIKKYFGGINGVIHSAGVIHHALISKKTRTEMDEVLAAKIYGTIHLDELTREEPLDCFILFSSISSIFNNFDQSDYAYANGFMDGFAQYRENLREQGQRRGKTTTINWPAWIEGGMRVDAAFIEWMEKTWGGVPLSTIDGLEVFANVVSQPGPQYLILPSKKRGASVETIEIQPQAEASSINEELLLSKILNQVTAINQ